MPNDDESELRADREAVSRYFRRLGKKGGTSRARKLGKARLREIAEHAASHRWSMAGRGITTHAADADLPDATDAALAACVRPVLAHPRTEARFQLATQTARRSGVAVGALVELVHHWPLLPEPVRAAIEDEPERLLGPSVPLLLAIVRRYLDPTDTR